MGYRNDFKQAAIFGGLVLGISLLNNLSVDIYGLIAAVSSFSIWLIHDAGKRYLDLTNQSDKVKNVFGVIVNPLTAAVCFGSLFYVIAGAMHWSIWLIMLLIASVFFAASAIPFFVKLK